jgi:spore maturation protein CgeB
MPEDKLLSYAYCPDTHYSMSDVEKDTDAVLVGMPYPQRIEWVQKLRDAGVSVLFENGPVFDEYRQMSNRAKIGLNWASMEDTNARVYETLAMRLCLVTNRTPDLAVHGLEEDRHYLGFSSMQEAVEKVLYAKNNPDICDMIANNGYQAVTQKNVTYDRLVLDVLKECGLYG